MTTVRQTVRPLWVVMWLVALLATGARAWAADASLVDRVWYPADRMPSLFPAGSELRVLPFAEFDELARRAAAASQRRERIEPRLARARHLARWEDGVLIGRTELVSTQTTDGPERLLAVDPWTPAISGSSPGGRLRVGSDGRLAVRVGSGQTEPLTIEWRLRARAGSDGDRFALGLPNLDVAELVLDLPRNRIPELDQGLKVEPSPGPTPDRLLWTIASVRGRMNLQLRRTEKESTQTGCWVDGTVRIDLNESPTLWRGDWTVVRPAGVTGALVVDLDPGLDPLDVSGPRVAAFRTEPRGNLTRLVVTMSGEGPTSSPVAIRAAVRVPMEGTWTIPAARFVDVVWTGERTLVSIDPGRVVSGLTNRDGRQVSARPEDPAAPNRLVFESVRPGPVAEFVFRRPTPEATVEIRGLMRVGLDLPRLEATSTWTLAAKSPAPEFAISLPAGWIPTHLTKSDGSTVPWRAVSEPDGGTRVVADLVFIPEPTRSVSLTLAAVAADPIPPGTGRLSLPRIGRSESGLTVADEVWTALVEPGVTLRPVSASGMAWIDPPAATHPDLEGTDRRIEGREGASLAWRWVGLAEASAQVERLLAPQKVSADLRTEVILTGGVIRSEWTIRLDVAGEPIRSLRVRSDGGVDHRLSWHAEDANGPTITTTPIENSARIPATGDFWELRFSRPMWGALTLRAHLERPWSGRGSVPILDLDPSLRSRSVVAVNVEPTTQLRVDATGFEAIDPASRPSEAAINVSRNSYHRAAMLVRTGAPAAIQLAVEPGRVEPNGGVIREATLRTEFPGPSRARHCLEMRLAVDTARSLELTLPTGAVVDRIRRDGQDATASVLGRSLVVAIPSPTALRPTCGITIDYRTDGHGGDSQSLVAGSVLPACPFPCVSFAWEIAAPYPWTVAVTDAKLVPVTSTPPHTWTSRWLGVESTATFGFRRVSTNQSDEILAELDRTAATISADAVSLGDYLTRLDSGRWPIIVDRFALADGGVGPGTRLTREAGPATLMTALADLRLKLIPMGGMALVTGRDAVVPSPEDAERIRQAAIERSDGADRFQSVLRWRGEATPRALLVGESPRSLVAAAGWEVHRFVAVGWPESGEGRVRFRDSRREAWLGWMVASLVLVAGITARQWAFRRRIVILAALGLAASAGIAWSWPGSSVIATGLVRGTFGLLAWWAGVRPVRPRTTGPSDDATWLTARPDRGSTRLVAPGLVLIFLTWTSAVGREVGPGPRPILAVFPYEGPAPDPERVPDRVVMLLADYDRMVRLAQPESSPISSTMSLLGVRHEVRKIGNDRVAVESVYDLWADGNGPGSWALPVGEGRELHVEVDGRPDVLAFPADGAEAQVTIEGPGTHAVRFRRWLPVIRISGQDEQIRLPINRAAFTRVAVLGSGVSTRVEFPETASGPTQSGDRVEALLGPEPTLIVRWNNPSTTRNELPPPQFDAEALWDLRLAGDRVRIRLTHDQPAGLSSFRLILDPDTSIREQEIPNMVGTSRQGSMQRPEWVAHIDPPWPAGVPIEFELWHPAGRDEIRRAPRLIPGGEARLTGSIIVRRPADWSGGLVDSAGIQTWSEIAPASSLERADDLSLVALGVGRFDGRWPDLASAARPVQGPVDARTVAVITARPGRLDALLEITLSAVGPVRHGHELTLPEGFQVLTVESDGLTGWRSAEPRLLSLRFDGPETQQRVVRIRGFVPTPAADPLGDAVPISTRIPWPLWSDVADQGGTIEVTGATRVILPNDGGTVAVSPPVGTVGTPGRSQYRVRPAGLIPTVIWTPTATRVDATIESNLILFPNTVHWTAKVRCDLAGGPAHSLTWRVPTAWTLGTIIEASDRTIRVVAETEGDLTRWTITPDEPWWTHAELSLRSVRPLEIGREWKFPDLATLAPVGRGKVRRYTVGLINVSGQSIEMSGSPGLREGDAARSRVDDSLLPAGPADRTFQVSGERWALRIVVGRESGSTQPFPGHASAQIVQGDLQIAIDTRGRGMGRAIYLLAKDRGLFLPIRLSRNARIPWATVDDRIVAPIHAGEGRWSIPLGSARSYQVCLSWTIPGGPPGSDLVLPALEQDDVPLLMAVAAPDSMNVSAGQGRFLRIAGPTWNVEAAERIAGRIVDSLSTIDRDSAADRAALIAELGRFEDHARELRRAKPPDDFSERAAHEARLGRLDAARTMLADSILDNGLEDVAQAATTRLGTGPDPSLAATDVLPEIADVIRPRQIGSMTYFRGVAPSLAHPANLIRSTHHVTWPKYGIDRWVALAVGLATTLALVRLVDRLGAPNSGRRRSLLITTFIGVGLTFLTPILGAACFGVGAAGRLTRRQR